MTDDELAQFDALRTELAKARVELSKARCELTLLSARPIETLGCEAVSVHFGLARSAVTHWRVRPTPGPPFIEPDVIVRTSGRITPGWRRERLPEIARWLRARNMPREVPAL